MNCPSCIFSCSVTPADYEPPGFKVKPFLSCNPFLLFYYLFIIIDNAEIMLNYFLIVVIFVMSVLQQSASDSFSFVEEPLNIKVGDVSTVKKKPRPLFSWVYLKFSTQHYESVEDFFFVPIFKVLMVVAFNRLIKLSKLHCTLWITQLTKA